MTTAAKLNRIIDTKEDLAVAINAELDRRGYAPVITDDTLFADYSAFLYTGASYDFIDLLRSFNDDITATRASSAYYWDDDGVLQEASTDAMRSNAFVDHDPATGEALGWLIEEQRVNQALQSDALNAGDSGSSTGWYQITRASIDPDVATDPEGGTTADKIVANTDNNSHLATNRTPNGVFDLAQPVTVSVFLKAGEESTAAIQLIDGTGYAANAQVYFDLAAGTVTTPTVANGASAAVGRIVNKGNGWYRCSLTATLGGSNTRIEARIYVTQSTASTIWTGDGVSGLFAWRLQSEQGAFATSPVKTTTASVIRARDIATITDLSTINFNAAEGSVLVEFVCPPLVSGQFPTPMAFNDNTFNNRLALFINGGTGVLGFVVTNGGDTQANITGATLLSGVVYRASISWKANSFRISVGGTGYAEATSGTVPTVNQAQFGRQITGSYLNGHLRQAIYIPRQLSQAELNSWSAS